jgi:hypothetical protein
MSNSTVQVNQTVSSVVAVSEVEGTVSVTQTAPITVVEVIAVGPQGIQGTAGEGISVEDSGKVDESLVYYSASSGEFKADGTWTTATLVLGGNF